MNPARIALSLLALAALAPAALVAQQRGARMAAVPEAYKPPAGMCRIWVDAVPPDKQPAPTDCSAALRNKPANGRVLFGESITSNRSGPPALMSRTLTPPIGGGVMPRSNARVLHDSAPPARGPVKQGRDVPKTGHDSSIKKPPQPS